MVHDRAGKRKAETDLTSVGPRYSQHMNDIKVLQKITEYMKTDKSENSLDMVAREMDHIIKKEGGREVKLDDSLLYSCFHGLDKIVGLFLERDKVTTDAKNVNGLSAASLALRSKHIETVMCLISHERYEIQPVDFKLIFLNASFHGLTELVFKAIEKFVKNKDRDLTEFLLENRDSRQVTALMMACFNNHRGIAMRLLDYAPDLINARNNLQQTVCHIVCHKGHHLLLDELLERKLDPNAKDSRDMTGLHFACQEHDDKIAERVHIVKSLLKVGVDPRRANNDNMIPLYFACQQGNNQVVKTLIESEDSTTRKEYIDIADAARMTPLRFAIMNSHVDVIKSLYEYGANVNFTDNNEFTCLHTMAYHGDVNVLEATLEHCSVVKPDFKAESLKFNTPIFVAMHRGNIEFVKRLAQHQPELLHHIKDGRTSLHLLNKAHREVTALSKQSLTEHAKEQAVTRKQKFIELMHYISHKDRKDYRITSCHLDRSDDLSCEICGIGYCEQCAVTMTRCDGQGCNYRVCFKCIDNKPLSRIVVLDIEKQFCMTCVHNIAFQNKMFKCKAYHDLVINTHLVSLCGI